MALNFLQSLFDPQRSPSMPINPAPVQPPMPEFGGNLQSMTQGALDNSRIANIMQAIGGTPEAAPVAMPQQPTQEPQRKRRSILDTVGGIADVIARVGGAEAMYQPTLDARADRQRMLEVEEMQNRLREQQLQIGGQTIEAGQGELADAGRSRLATALGAIASNPDAVAMWPQIAAEAGIDEQQANAIGQIIQSNPDAAGIFARSLGWSPEPTRQGSQAKELQVYGLLQKESPELAESYLQSLVNPEGMSDYQRAQLAIAMRRLDLDQQKFTFDREVKETELEGEQEEPGDSNSVANILQDFGVVLDGPEDPVADMIRNSTNGWVQYGAAMIPGAFGTSTEGMEQIAKLQTIDNALILALAGGKLGAGVSNADRTFFEQMSGRVSDPTIPADQRLAAWNQIKQRFRGIVEREKKPRATAPARRTAPAAPSRAAPARTAPPAAPAASVGANRQSIEAELRRRGIQVPR